jgi:hypothetical protein
MQRGFLVLFVLALGFLGYYSFSTTSSQPGALSYTTDWQQGVKAAQEAGKPILLNFGGPW